MVAKKDRLGKGLSALFGEYLPEGESPLAEAIRVVPVAKITPNPFQPRREFSAEQLAELESSIRENGLLQPLVVRPAHDGAARSGIEWELVAGERRWRAVRRLGWTEVPVVPKEVDDRAMLVLAVVENVQRADLSPVEEAAAYRRMIDDFGFTQRRVAETVGRERSTVANLLRLLQLPVTVQRMVDEGALSMGHARALLGLSDERGIRSLAREIVQSGLSVRTVEERVRERRDPSPVASGAQKTALPPSGDPHVRHLESELQRAFGTPARIRLTQAQSGRIEIPFYNPEDFERVMELLLGTEAGSS